LNPQPKEKGELNTMAFPTMTTTQQFTASISPKDRKGKPAPVDGIPVWASSNEAVAGVVPNPDGMSALIVAQGVGDYTISVAADADLGAGVTTITGQDTGAVSQGTATNVGIQAGPVEEQPDATPIP
jgi:hypothetical protein